MFRQRQPLHDANAAAGGKDLGDLPEWDLTDLYAAPDAPELKRDMDWLEEACADFAGTTRASWPSSTPRACSKCVQRYERIDTGRAGGSCPSPACATTSRRPTPTAPRSCPTARTGSPTITTPLVFFSLEVNRIDDDRLDALFADNAELARYRPVFDRLRAMRPYQLSDELEKFLHDQSVVGATAWNKLFDETIAGLEFDVDGEVRGHRGHAEPADRAGPRQARGRRARAGRVFGQRPDLRPRPQHADQGEGDRGPLAQDAHARRPAGTCRTTSSRRSSRRCATRSSAPIRASRHRYYELKRKWLGLDRMQVWDRNAPAADGGRPVGSAGTRPARR